MVDAHLHVAGRHGRRAGIATPPALRATKPCVADDDDIVICGRSEQPYRLKPLAPRYDEATVPKAAVHVLGATGAAEAEAASVGGIPSNRAMVRLKLPF